MLASRFQSLRMVLQSLLVTLLPRLFGLRVRSTMVIAASRWCRLNPNQAIRLNCGVAERSPIFRGSFWGCARGDPRSLEPSPPAGDIAARRGPPPRWGAGFPPSSAVRLSGMPSMLRGHYAYFGISRNNRALGRFRLQVMKAWPRVLLRRSQRPKLSWERFNALLKVLTRFFVHAHFPIFAEKG